MAPALATSDLEEEAVALYLDLRPEDLVDLEVAAAAAIQWSRGLKAAARVADPDFEYRVTLIAAEPGSSRWLARMERYRSSIEASKANLAVERLKTGWERVPLILRLSIGLGVVVPLTIDPTIEWWTDTGDFSPVQVQQIEETMRKVANDPSVTAHRKAIYKEVQRDPKITAVGAGVPDGEGWKPKRTVPADRFAEADGLFDLQKEPERERIIPATLDVILVTPRLENAARVWTFRQEGIPGTITATMKDKRFLAALEKAGIRETLRANIPMRIRLEIRQKLIDGEWKVTPRGRAVVEVLSPAVP
ncbi:hypothetical protein [Sphingomonas koreensis]